MFGRLVWDSLMRRKRRRLAAVVAIAAGSGVATAIIAVSSGFGDQLARDLRANGANIEVVPAHERFDEQAHIRQAEMFKLKGKGFFWRNNIVSYAPVVFGAATATNKATPVTLAGTWFDRALPDTVGRFGMKHVKPWWRIKGAWPREGDGSEVLVGSKLAEILGVREGESLMVSAPGGVRWLRVVGVVTAGGADDERAFAPLETVQTLCGLQGKVKRIYVSALTTPDETIAKDKDFDPLTLPPEAYERFLCTPTAYSIAFQIDKSLDFVKAKVMRQVDASEARVFAKLEAMVGLLAAAAILGAALGVMAAMGATIVERRREFGILSAVGATPAMIASLVVCEAIAMALAGGAIGTVLSGALGVVLGQELFGRVVLPPVVMTAVSIGSSILIALLGIALPLRQALQVRPAEVLHEA